MKTSRTVITADDFEAFTTAVVALATYLTAAPGGRQFSAAFDIPLRDGVDIDLQPLIDILNQLPGVIITTAETRDIHAEAAQRAHDIIHAHAQLLVRSQAGAASLERVIAQALFEAMRGLKLPATPQGQSPRTLRDIAQDFFTHNLGLMDDVPRLMHIADALDGATLEARRTILTAAMLTLAADEQEAATEAAAEEAAEQAMNDD